MKEPGFFDPQMHLMLPDSITCFTLRFPFGLMMLMLGVACGFISLWLINEFKRRDPEK